jgi:hypothetical protein
MGDDIPFLIHALRKRAGSAEVHKDDITAEREEACLKLITIPARSGDVKLPSRNVAGEEMMAKGGNGFGHGTSTWYIRRLLCVCNKPQRMGKHYPALNNVCLSHYYAGGNSIITNPRIMLTNSKTLTMTKAIRDTLFCFFDFDIIKQCSFLTKCNHPMHSHAPPAGDAYDISHVPSL